MKLCVLASGSKGNAIFVESEYARVLIDAGLSAREIENRLRQIEVEPSSIDAIVLTHAHNDHVRGVGVFARRFHTPIVAHPDTLDDITRLLRGTEPLQPWHEPFKIKDLSFTPFELSHDSFPTVGYLISNYQKSLAICTDLGVVTTTVVEHLQQANFILLESNHDPDMLLNGPYPWDLKERIASRVGHLSNHNAGELLSQILSTRLKQVLLGHLSEENNTPELALETVIDYVGEVNRGMITVLPQRQLSQIFHL